LDRLGRRALLHRRRGVPDGSALLRGWAVGAASCRDSAAVRRCRLGRRGWSSGGYPRSGGEACCSARLDWPGVPVAAQTNAAEARSCRRRRDCCLPAATEDPASATGGERLLGHRVARPVADRPAAVGEPRDVPPPGAWVPPACPALRPEAR
ncbi:MAG: hypothetical protein WCE78_09305, partial [Pseudonocardiaceae bacterium]